MILLTTYSPDLNPGEFLNNDVKANAVGRCRPSSRKGMIAEVRGYLRTTQMRPDIVKSYFHAPSVPYAMHSIVGCHNANPLGFRVMNVS
jgi:hypothetical protein